MSRFATHDINRQDLQDEQDGNDLERGGRVEFTLSAANKLLMERLPPKVALTIC
jgi:hypothetical protein